MASFLGAFQHLFVSTTSLGPSSLQLLCYCEQLFNCFTTNILLVFGRKTKHKIDCSASDKK